MDPILLILAYAAGATLTAFALYNKWMRTPTGASASEKSKDVPGSAAPLLGKVFGGLVGLIWAWVIFLGLGAGVIYLFNLHKGSENILQLVMLNRYGVLGAAFLVSLPALALLVVPSALGGVFVVRSHWQLFNITWIAVLVATMTVVTARVLEYNSPARFGTQPLPWSNLDDKSAEWTLVSWRTLTVLLLGLPIPITCLVCSLVQAARGSPRNLAYWAGVGLGLGLLTGSLMVVATAKVQDVILSDCLKIPGLLPGQNIIGEQPGPWHTEALSDTFDWLAGLLSYLDHRGYGCCQQRDDQGTCLKYTLRPGHAQVLIGMLVVLIVYLSNYYLSTLTGWRPSPDTWFPSLFLVLLLALLVGLVLQGAAFALDRFRVPVTLAFGLFSFVLSKLNRTDHFFLLQFRPRPEPTQPAKSAEERTARLALEATPASGHLHLRDAAAAWHLPEQSRAHDASRPSGRTLVVVTASGGGIQASAWAARVLVGLHQRYGDPFSRSIRLLSAVSGGSVGVMYYLDRWQAQGPVFLSDALPQPDGTHPPGSICGRAMESSLEATAWGLAYPDLLRAALPPLLYFTPNDDRGARIEDVWRHRLTQPQARLSDWVRKIRTGSMPIAVFNATVVETGQRFLAAPVIVAGQDTAIAVQQLLLLYPNADPWISTAVRLSATFPFISPICRPSPDPLLKEEQAYHFCDGGYVDNEGMVTAIEWLWHLLDLPPERRKFDQILIVRLIPFPRDAQPAPAASNVGWVYDLLGPLEGIMNVRVASQIERNDLAVRQFQEGAQTRKIPVGVATFTYAGTQGASPPLSWMLTPGQQNDIEAAWRGILNDSTVTSPLKEIERFFDRRPQGS